MFDLFWAANFMKIGHIAILRANLPKFLISGQDLQFQISYLWLTNLSNFIALGIYFIFGTKFSWNEEIDTCFNVECVLLGHNFDFLDGYLVVTARYWWLLLVAPRYWSFPLLVWTKKTNSWNSKNLLGNVWVRLMIWKTKDINNTERRRG